MSNNKIKIPVLEGRKVTFKRESGTTIFQKAFSSNILDLRIFPSYEHCIVLLENSKIMHCKLADHSILQHWEKRLDGNVTNIIISSEEQFVVYYSDKKPELRYASNGIINKILNS